MKLLSYNFILLFVYVSALPFISNASPSNGFSQFTKVPLPMFRSALVSTMELVRNVTSTMAQIHDSDDPHLDLTIAHCTNLLGETADALNWTLSSIDQENSQGHTDTQTYAISHARTLLNASLGSHETCHEVFDATKQVTTSIYTILDMLQLPQGSPDFSKVNDASILIASNGLDDFTISGTANVTVSQDGNGDFMRIADAIAAAPCHSTKFFIIEIKKGIYEEYVNIDNTKSNLVLIGEGKDATIISGNRSVGGGQQTITSATFAVRALGFIAIGIGFENTAGPENQQAVALLAAGDRSVFFRCKITGNQDTLLVQSGRQFYRECQITGTVDFIFGYGSAVFQRCTIYIKKNSNGGTSVLAAHGRNFSSDSSGFSFQFCNINGDPNVVAKDSTQRGAYLGRSWGAYARTVFMQCSMSNVLRQEGWLQWHNDSVNKLYFGEYLNTGLGAAVENRVTWPGYHKKMTMAEADEFTVAKLIDGKSWLTLLGFPLLLELSPSAEPPMSDTGTYSLLGGCPPRWGGVTTTISATNCT